MEPSTNNPINLIDVTNTIMHSVNNSLLNEFGYDIFDNSINYTNLTNTIIDSVNNSLLNEFDNSSSEFNSNHTNKFTDKQRTHLAFYHRFVYFVASLIIVSNLIVVISSGLIIKNRQQPRNAYILLGNVALADAISGISLILGISVPKKFFSHSLCAVQLGIIVSTTLTSIYSVGLIAIDRYLYILYGLHYQIWVKKSRVRLMIAGIWILGLVVGFMPLTGWSGDVTTGKHCWYIKLYPPTLIVINSLLGFLPVVVVCVLYSIILYNAIKKVTQLQKADNTQGQSENGRENKMRIFRGKSQHISNNRISTISSSVSETNENGVTATDTTANDGSIQKPWTKLKNILTFKKKKKEPLPKEAPPTELSKWKALKIVMLTMGSFVITWVPYFITTLIYVACDPEKTPEQCKRLQVAIASPLAILGMLNSLLNPMIYAWWHTGFKKSIKAIFLRLFRRKRLNKQLTQQSLSTNTKSSSLKSK